ncbi:Mannosylfructose-phosphate synthase [Gimesia aquarii]|uniref:Mannosylfructose-phosphate synthase n=2 Tax=Gimesia aquarii TaxID=2527964 RepID=A0A517VPH3_9PLAN|nr:Mannosylfructose-phosphate synthase [Gimesia aquarii]
MLAVLSQLHQRSFEFSAFCPADGLLHSQLAQLNIEHHPISFHNERGQRLSREELALQIVPILKSDTFDLLHANSLSMSRLTGALTEQIPVPCSGHLRDIIKLSKAAIRDLNQNQCLVAVSEATKKFHIAQGLQPEKVTVCYNGVNTNRFQPRPATGILKQELGLKNDDRLCLTIGQIGLRKGQDILARAATILAERGHQNLHFLLIGERHSQKQESIDFDQAVSTAFETPILQGRLHRLGYREDIDRLMNEADLLIHPAKQEPLGRVLLEALASGLPIVTTDVGGTREIVQHENSALLVAANDPIQLAKAVEQSLNDQDLLKNLAFAGRQRALELFTEEQASQQIEQFWHNSFRS